jgi:hypothetical protein
MDDQRILSQQGMAAWLLIASGSIFLPGGLLFAGRAILKWQAAQSQRYLYLERGLVMASFVTVVLGLVLLDRLLEAAGENILAPIGLAIILIATCLVLAAETCSLSRQDCSYASIVTFVVLAFVGQAVFGAALLRTGLVPGWAGWATIAWNLAWLIILPIARPKDIYYPWLHFVAPVLIGIELLLKG